MSKGFIKKHSEIFLSGIIICIIIGVIFCIKGIYPFGSKNISYFDMSQSMVPLYYYTYDVLHGTRDAMWNWYSAAGIPMIDTIGNFLISPFNILFYLIKRDQILNAMSYLLLIKVAACAMSMTFYTKKTFNDMNHIWHIVFGVMYASSGFILQYYTNIHFLDIVALFPLTMYFLDKLFTEKKIIGYIVCLSIGFINSMYLMFMVCLFIVFYTAYYVCFETKDRKKIISLVALASVIAALLTAAMWVPVVIQLLSSSRMEITEDNKLLEIFNTILNTGEEQKRFMLYGCELSLAGVIAIAIKKKSIRINLGRYLFLLVLLILPIKYELVNIRWHLGGYVEFPMRFGYMLSFVCLCMLARIIRDFEKDDSNLNMNKVQKILEIVGISVIPFCVILLYSYLSNFLDYGIRDENAYKGYWSYMGIMAISFLIILFIKNTKMRRTLIIMLLVAEISLGWYGFLAPNMEMAPECTDEIVINSEKVKSTFWLNEDETTKALNRVKDGSVSLNTNYPYICQKAAFSNWTLGTNHELLELFSSLGYGEAYTRIVDCGGTLFSDALFHITDILTKEEKDARVYNELARSQDYLLYESIYYPFGILLDDYSYSEELSFSESAIENQKLLAAFMGLPENLFTIIRIEEDNNELVENLYEIDFNISINGLKELYVESVGNSFYLFEIDGNAVLVPDITDSANITYPAYFNNGILDLGTYENQTINIKIYSDNPIVKDDLLFSLLDIDTLSNSIKEQELTKRNYNVSKKKLTYDIESDKEQYLFLPIAYRRGLNVMLNGEKIDYQGILNNTFIALKLKQGNNSIKISYMPNGLILGLCMTFIGIFCLILFCRSKNRIIEARELGLFILSVFLLVVLILIAYLMVIPIIRTFYYFSLV